MHRNTHLDGSAGLRPKRLETRPLFALESADGDRPPEFRLYDGLQDGCDQCAPVGKSSQQQELVIVDGSCTELRRLHSELALVDHGERSVLFSVLYPQADHVTNPVQLIRNTVFEHNSLSLVHLLLRVEDGNLVFGRELIDANSLLGDEDQQTFWRSALCIGAEVLCYDMLVTDFSKEGESIPSELVHPLRLPPVLMAVEQEALVFDGSGSAVPVTESVLMLSPASGKIAAATVKISDGFVAGEDELVYTPDTPHNTVAEMISGKFNAQTGVLELSGTASAMLYGEALKGVYFLNNSSNPSDHLREIEITVSDAGVVSNVMTRPVTVYPVDDSPQNSDVSLIDQTSTFSDAIKAIECSGAEPLFTIIEPAYGFDILKNGEPVFSFTRADIDNGSIALSQDAEESSNGTIYLEVDDGQGAIFGVVVSVGKFGAVPDHGLEGVPGLESRFTAEPHDLVPPDDSQDSAPDGDDQGDDLRYGT